MSNFMQTVFWGFVTLFQVQIIQCDPQWTIRQYFILNSKHFPPTIVICSWNVLYFVLVAKVQLCQILRSKVVIIACYHVHTIMNVVTMLQLFATSYVIGPINIKVFLQFTKFHSYRLCSKHVYLWVGTF